MTDDTKIWERRFVFGRFTRLEVLDAIKDGNWQCTRRAMLATSLDIKWALLEDFLYVSRGSRDAQICVTNYIYALKRGGLLKRHVTPLRLSGN